MRDGDFLVRSKEISRVEGLSDAVFGFAITLLVVSLEVPKSPDEVLHAMRGFLAFAASFAILFMIWRTQFKFFRRYGLADDTTVALTAVLLFTVLFFVYPLKFIMGAITGKLLKAAGFPESGVHISIDDPNVTLLFVAYGLGWFALFGVFALLYRHAYKQRDHLKLNPIELFDTTEAIWATTAASVMGSLIALLNFLTYALPGYKDQVAYAGILVVMLPFIVILRRRRGRKARRREMIDGA